MTSETTLCDGELAPRRSSLRVGDTTLSYLEWGAEGPPALLLHGITSSARTWWRVGPALAARGFHVFALDMPGHGASDATDDHRIEALAELAHDALVQLADAPTALVGHSWGGSTSLVLAHAIRGSGLLASATLIDPAMEMEPVRGGTLLPNYLDGIGQTPEETTPKLRASNPDWHECDVSWKAEALTQCRAAAVAGFFTASGTWSLTERLSEIDVPLLVLVADPEKTVLRPEVREAAAAALRPGRGEMLTIPGTTHNMFRGDGYSLSVPPMLDWIASHDSRSQKSVVGSQ